VKNWFQRLPFKCNLQRYYTVGQVAEAEVMYTALREVEVYDQPALWWGSAR
jgi:hypothetical protein